MSQTGKNVARSNESGVAALFVIAGLIWWCYSYLYAPTHKAESGTVPDDRQNQVLIALAVALPQAVPRLELLQGDNLNIYITRREFQSVPFPDRSDVLRKVGTKWCSLVDHIFLPAIEFRDISTGTSLGSYGCVSGSTWLAAEP